MVNIDSQGNYPLSKKEDAQDFGMRRDGDPASVRLSEQEAKEAAALGITIRALRRRKSMGS